MNTLIESLFAFTLKNKSAIIKGFQFLNIILFGIILVGSYAIYISHSSAVSFYMMGIYAGRMAVIFFTITLIPGILRRFGSNHKIATIIMLFRRYTGILVYISALMHFMFVRFVYNILQYGGIPPQVAAFEVFGLLALNLLLLLFLTSNNVSVTKMGVWWKRLHSLVYVIVWLIFLHIMLLQWNIWAILIGITASVELLSHIVHIYKKGTAK